MSLSGQWISKYSGSNSGNLVIDIDEGKDCYYISAIAWDFNILYPSSLVAFQTPTKATKQSLKGLPVKAIDGQGVFFTPDKMMELNKQNVYFPSTVDVELELQGSDLHVEWITSIATYGITSARMPKRGGHKNQN